MRKHFLFPLSLLLCAVLTGCAASGSAPEEFTEPSFPDYEEMEIYKQLRSAVTDESSLEEMVNAFEQVCAIPVETTSEMFLYEIYSYESEGKNYLLCHIVRQVDEPDSDEYIQLCLDITYCPEEDLSEYDEATWFEADSAGFLDYIRSHELNEIFAKMPIHQRHVSIYAT